SAGDEGLVIAAVEHEVLGDGEVADEALDLAVLGDEPDPGLERLAHRATHDLVAVEHDRALDVRRQADHGLGELGLAVALDSGGVSTAVGSSKTSTSASRESALMISTRCCTPTGRSSTSASGSTWKPRRSEMSRTCLRAASRSSLPANPVALWPSITFSATVK